MWMIVNLIIIIKKRMVGALVCINYKVRFPVVLWIENYTIVNDLLRGKAIHVCTQW